MYDTPKVIIGLGLFALVFGYPFYNNLLSGEYTPPALAKAKGDVCVEDPEWMRANHMTLLDEWRHAVSRDGLRTYTSATTGKVYLASLQRTCMDCHGTYDEFCNKCHLDNSVNAYCWTCHVSPEAAGGGVSGGLPAKEHAEDAHGEDSHAKATIGGQDMGHGHGAEKGYLGFKQPHPDRSTPPTHDGTLVGGGAAGHGTDAHGQDAHGAPEGKLGAHPEAGAGMKVKGSHGQAQQGDAGFEASVPLGKDPRSPAEGHNDHGKEHSHE